MYAIVNPEAGKLEWRDIPLPEPGPGQARVKVHYSAVSDRDLQAVITHERAGVLPVRGCHWCGRVTAVGDPDDKHLVGQLVVGGDLQSNGGELGFEEPGGWAEALLVETETLQLVPEDVNPAVATLAMPLASARHAIDRSLPEDGDDCLIFGDGALGLLLLMLLHEEDVGQVVLVGSQPGRLRLATELGADQVFDFSSADGDILTLHDMDFANIFETTGLGTAVHAALGVAGSEAAILLAADYGPQQAEFALNLLVHREIEIIGSYGPGDAWEDVGDDLELDLPYDRLITHRFPAGDWQQAIATARDDADAAQVLLDWRRVR